MHIKRALLASTFLAAATQFAVSPAQAAQFEMTVGGFMEQWFGYTDGPANNQGFDQQSDGEIEFAPEIALDNGLTVGVSVQLEAKTDGDQIDQQFLFVEGSFGRLVMGSENSAPYLMSITVPSAGAGLDSGDLPNWIAGMNGFLINTANNFAADEDSSEKVSYFTPRFAGFQLGVSYVPQLQEDIDAPANNNDATRDDAFGVAVNFDHEFGDFTLGASAGYMHYGDDAAAAGEAPENLAFGLSLGYGGFTVAGAYNDLNDSVAGDIESFGIGALYDAGPFSVSLGYIYGEDKGADSDSNAFELGGSYVLGPGVSAVGSIFYGEQETAGVKTDGVAVIGGLALTF